MTWAEIEGLAELIYQQIMKSGNKYKGIYAIPRGGLILAVLLSHKLNIPMITDFSKSNAGILFADDILDTGKTASAFLKERLDSGRQADIAVLVLNDKCLIKPAYYGAKNRQNIWIQFPWEVNTSDEVSKVNYGIKNGNSKKSK